MNYIWVYRRILSMYPKDYQFRFAAEMAAAFETGTREHIRSGKAGLTRFLIAEFGAVLVGSGSEWIAKWTTDVSGRSRHLPDLRMMPLPWVPQEARNRLLGRHECLRGTSQ